MTKLIHMQTQISTVFGLVDEDGNAIPQTPVTVQVGRLTPEDFADAHDTIVQQRDQAIAAYEAEQAAPSAPNGNRAAKRHRAKARPSAA